MKVLNIIQDEDGHFVEYDDTYDLTIHCTSQEEQDEVLMKLNRMNRAVGTDVISRTEVLSHAKTERGNGHEQPFDYVEVDVIKQLPPVNPAEKVGHWIPVSERLPEFTNNKFAVRTHFTEDVLVYDGTDLRVGYFARKDKLDRDYWVVYGDDYFEPIAWMPLPEPYKGGEQNE